MHVCTQAVSADSAFVLAMRSTLLAIDQHQRGQSPFETLFCLLACCMPTAVRLPPAVGWAYAFVSISAQLAVLSTSVRGAKAEALHQVQAAGGRQAGWQALSYDILLCHTLPC